MYKHFNSSSSSIKKASEPSFSADIDGRLLAASHIRKLQNGEVLFDAGSMPLSMFRVVQGAIRISATSVDGRELVLSVMLPGQWFGEAPLLDGLPRAYRAQATSDSEVAALDADRFMDLARTDWNLLLAVTRLVCHRYRMTLAWIDDAALMPLPVRLARRLVALGADGHSISFAQNEYAAQLGVSRQSINRILQVWVKNGWIDLSYRSIKILRPDELPVDSMMAQRD